MSKALLNPVNPCTPHGVRGGRDKAARPRRSVARRGISKTSSATINATKRDESAHKRTRAVHLNQRAPTYIHGNSEGSGQGVFQCFLRHERARERSNLAWTQAECVLRPSVRAHSHRKLHRTLMAGAHMRTRRQAGQNCDVRSQLWPHGHMWMWDLMACVCIWRAKVDTNKRSLCFQMPQGKEIRVGWGYLPILGHVDLAKRTTRRVCVARCSWRGRVRHHASYVDHVSRMSALQPNSCDP